MTQPSADVNPAHTPRRPMITAKVQVNTKLESGVGDARQVVVAFTADHAGGRNKEWALYTPSLQLSLSLKGEIADRFDVGSRWTLQFAEEE
jgi:hypothetical protein